MHECASKLTREKSMELIADREEYIQDQMQKIAAEEYQSEILEMLEDEKIKEIQSAVDKEEFSKSYEGRNVFEINLFFCLKIKENLV